MGEKKQKAFVKNAPLLFFLFIVFALVLMTRLLVETETTERVEVEARFNDMVADYATELRDVLLDMRDQGDVVGTVAGRLEATDERGIQAALVSVANIRDNYLAVLCDLSGNAIYKVTGEQGIRKTDLSTLSYFTDIVESGRGYLYIPDDEIVGKNTIVCISNVESEGEITGYFLQYYDVSRFKDFAKRTEFGSGSQIWVIDGAGNVLAYSGLYDNYLSEKHNFWEELDEQGITEEQIGSLKQVMKDKNVSLNRLEQKNGDHVYVCARVGISDWNVVAEITSSYLDKQVEREGKTTKDIAVQLIVLTVLFGCVALAISIISVTTDKESKASLEAKADTDLLTDLYNKAATERKIREYISEFPDRQGLMFVLDIDNFKKINDTMGHAFGDEVLRAVGIMIKTEFRATDIIGRTGGDEFTIFLKDVKEEEEIRKQVERILRFFSNLQVGEYVKYSPNASIGAAVFPRDAADFEGLYKAADSALYVAKNRGKNQLAFYGQDK